MRYFLPKAIVTTILVPREPLKPCVSDAAEILLDRVGLSAQAVLRSIAFEVRFDTGACWVGMEGRKHESSTLTQGGKGLTEKGSEVSQMLRDQRAQDRVEHTGADREAFVQVGSCQRRARRIVSSDSKHTEGEVEAQRAHTGPG